MKKLSLISIFLTAFILASLISGCASSGTNVRKKKLKKQENLMRELHYGRLLALKVLQRYPLLEDEKLTKYVNKVGKSVALFSGRSDIMYHFAVLDSESVNAFAAPGGYVFITIGAIKLMKNEAELAGVLAHEIGHINHKHIMKTLPPPRETSGAVDIIASILLAQGSTVSTAFQQVIDKAAETLFKKGYLIKDEFEADKSALFYTSATGYYPGGIIDFLTRMMDFKKRNKKATVYNTHPSTQLRLDKLKNIITTNGIEMKGPKIAKRLVKIMDHIMAEVRKIRKKTVSEIVFGKIASLEIIKKYPLVKNKLIQLYINQIGKSVAMFSGRSDLEYTIGVIDSKDILLYALPGGYIYISKGALKLASNEAEVAAIIATGVGLINKDYLLKRHPLPANLKYDGGKKVPASLKRVAKVAAKESLTIGYHRNEIFAADESAIIYLDSVGYSTKALLTWMKKVRTIKTKKTRIFLTGKASIKSRISKIWDTLKTSRQKIGTTSEKRFKMIMDKSELFKKKVVE